MSRRPVHRSRRRPRRRPRPARHALRAAAARPRDVTAVVTVADDGGSSGRLRRELGLLPPGDLRMALAALAGEHTDDGAAAPTRPGSAPAAPLRRQRGAGRARRRQPAARRAHGGARRPGRRAGRASAALVGARGRVLPMACEPLDIEAEVTGLDDDDPGRSDRIRGQVAVASTPGRVRRVRLLPERAAVVPRGRGRRAGRGRPAARARAPGSPACCRTCCCRSCATRW